MYFFHVDSFSDKKKRQSACGSQCNEKVISVARV
jgi:hypothetical protein